MPVDETGTTNTDVQPIATVKELVNMNYVPYFLYY